MRVTTAEEFWTHVDRRSAGECWNWKATSPSWPNGYGRVYGFGQQRAHRIAYILVVGSIPANRIITHDCDNPACCNPAHLRLGDHSSNGRETYARLGHSYPASFYGRRTGQVLTAVDVQDIRRKLEQGERQIDIARSYGVSQPLISKIKLGLVQYERGANG